jgi:tRNA (adenine22-N1)-methyltransferase
LELPLRLAAIARFIPPYSRVADIGTDHAKLPQYLVKTNRSPRVIATELNEKPYREACRQVLVSEPGGRIEVRKGDGLEALRPGEVDLVVIAGLGGNTMVKMLACAREILAGISRLVLQPMTDAGNLRLWLLQNGWRLADEELVKEEEKFYVIIVAEPGEGRMEDEILLEIGPLLVKKCSPLLLEYLEKVKGDYQRVLSGLARSRSIHSIEKAIEITSRLKKIIEVINRCRQDAGTFSR